MVFSFHQEGEAPPDRQVPPSQFGPQPEMMRAGRYFFVKLGQRDEVLETNFEMMFDFTEIENAVDDYRRQR